MSEQGLKQSFNDNVIVPYVTEDTPKGERTSDIYSRLLKDRIIFMPDQVNQTTAGLVVAQLLFLESQKSATKEHDDTKEINFYIMSPGGDVDAGMAVYDTMQLLKSKGMKIHTWAMGRAMSMGSIFLVGGSPGCRHALPSARIMLHQPSGGSEGKATDMDVSTREINHMLHRKAMLYEAHTNMTYRRAMNMLKKPDFYLRPEEAKKLGVIDVIEYPALPDEPKVAKAMKDANDDHAQMRKEPSPGLPPRRPRFSVNEP
jgi:ATP-dependent Clp protease protease subunit